jgi:uncharacterized membrane protein required for colicin V production
MTLTHNRLSAIIIIISLLGGYVLLYLGHDQSVATLASVILSFYFGRQSKADTEN